MNPTSQFTRNAKLDYEYMLERAPWFDPAIHYLVGVDDDNGNVHQLIFAGKTRESCEEALDAAFDVADKLGRSFNPTLIKNGKCLSFVLK